MHPALSVIFFTVMSGAGFGLFILLALFDLFGIGGRMASGDLYTMGITALVLTSAGLLSSTLHLANPKNAWRAFSRYKTSWLAREGVFAVLFYPFAVLYLGGVWLNGGVGNNFTQVMAFVAILLAIATVFSTGMIYACLKTIRQWNTSLTPTNYLLLGLALGSLIMTTIRGDALSATLALILIAAAALTKTIYYFWIGQPKGATINTATGFTRAAVKILDVGHTAGTFLTKEFGYVVSAGAVRNMRLAVFALGFILPALFMIGLLETGNTSYAVWAVASAFVGIGVERWLFFAEARHVVNLYHGAQRT